MKTEQANLPLAAAGVLLLLIAAAHLAALFVGPAAFDYMDAPQLGDAVRGGAWWPVPLTVVVTAVFGAFAAVAFSGAGLIRPLPMLDRALLVVGGVFTVRGVGVVYFTWLVIADSPRAIPQEIGFSLVALLVGALVLIGWRSRR